jgi:predicted phosphate transport protein (TIGR00153 family)
MRLLPREEKFFLYFDRQVEIITDAAAALLSGVRSSPDQLSLAVEKIRELEHKGDEVIHETFLRLNQTFITPLDPEDIHTLASHLDDVCDAIEEAAHRMVAYRVQPIPQAMVEVCEIIVNCGEALKNAFSALSKNKPLLEHCIEINRLEDRADRIVRAAVADLFQNEKDPIQLIKLKEVYEILEKSTDYCEDVADVLQEVMVKNG